MNSAKSSSTSRSANALLVSTWLCQTHNSNPTPSYRHSRLTENTAAWAPASGLVLGYFKSAHNDAIARLHRLAGTSLHPAGTPTQLPAPYYQYPFGLPAVTLQGYFGEILAGLLAETVGAAGHNDWEVPAHLFHTHVVVFQQLEQQAQSGTPVTTIVGRTGDDCLAFRRNPQGHIASVLFCESKCTAQHDARLINDAHNKTATSGIVDILQLVEALESRGCPDADEWANALRVFHTHIHASQPSLIDRCDAVYYVHGQASVQRPTWITPDKPHTNYTSNRSLHAVEVHLDDVLARVRSIYHPGVWT